MTGRPGHEPYSPRLRTALVLCGTGTQGAYHAGVLRALREAGVKIDLVAGRGIGVVGALFGAIDGGSRLWAPDGCWLAECRPLSVATDAAPSRVDTVDRARADAGPAWRAGGRPDCVSRRVPSDTASPPCGYRPGRRLRGAGGRRIRSRRPADLVPQVVVLLCGALLVQLVLASRRAASRAGRRRARGVFWWRVVGAPLSSREASRHWRAALWRLMTGGSKVALPDSVELSRRYAEVLGDGLGQPGFREFIAVVHDLDTRHDLVAALLEEAHRPAFFGRGPGGSGRSDRPRHSTCPASAGTTPWTCWPRRCRCRS